MKRLFLIFFPFLAAACSSAAVFAPPASSMTTVLFSPNFATVGKDGREDILEYGRMVAENEAVCIYGSLSRRGPARQKMLLTIKRIAEITKILRESGLSDDQIIADLDPNPDRIGLQTPLSYDDEMEDRVFLQIISRY